MSGSRKAAAPVQICLAISLSLSSPLASLCLALCLSLIAPPSLAWLFGKNTTDKQHPASDIWSLGAIVFEVSSRQVPYDGKSQKQLLMNFHVS